MDSKKRVVKIEKNRMSISYVYCGTILGPD